MWKFTAAIEPIEAALPTNSSQKADFRVRNPKLLGGSSTAGFATSSAVALPSGNWPTSCGLSFRTKSATGQASSSRNPMYLSASVYGIWDARYGPSLLPMEPITATPTYVIPMARPRFSLNQFEMITWCGIGPDRKYPIMYKHHAPKYSH